MTRARRTTRPRHRPAGRTAVPFAAGVAAGAGLARALGSGPARVARIGRLDHRRADAAGWITDFLNAAYFHRAEAAGGARDVDDLRLALAVVTTAGTRRATGACAPPTSSPSTARSGATASSRPRARARGTLDPGPAPGRRGRLLGPWFAEAYADDARRGWGIAFPTVAAKAPTAPRTAWPARGSAAHAPRGAAGPSRPGTRTRRCGCRRPTASSTPSRPERGRTRQRGGPLHPLRTGGLAGQTFEIEVVAGAAAGAPSTPAATSPSRASSRPRRPRGAARLGRQAEEGMAASAATSRASCRGARRRWRPSTSRRTRATSWAGRNRLSSTSTRARRGAGRGYMGRDAWHLEQAYRRAAATSSALLGRGRCGDVDAPPARDQSAGAAGLRREPTPSSSGRPERAGRRHRAGRGGPGGPRARGPGPPRRRGRARRSSTLPGFHHDIFSSVYPAGAASPVFAAGARAPRAARGCTRSLLAHPAGRRPRASRSMRDLDATAATLDAVHPGDGAAWRDLAGPYAASTSTALRATMLSGFPPVAGPAGCCRGAQPGRHPRLRPDPAQLRPGLGAAALRRPGRAGVALRRGDARRRRRPTAGRRDRRRVPQAARPRGRLAEPGGRRAGGSRTRSRAACAPSGGEVRTGARVDRILAGRGRVAGVRTAGGERVHARGSSSADSRPARCWRWRGDALPGAYRAGCARYRYGPSTLKVDWALDGPIPWAARRSAARAPCTSAAPRTRSWRRSRRPTRRCPSGRSCCSASSRVADPTRAPAGKHTAWAYTHGPHAASTGRPSRTATSSASRRRSSASRPASAT